MKILCTICARKGSKGVKNKNLKTINKKPLIFYSIDQAKKSKLFKKIVISTDSKKIKNYVKKLGIDCWFLRPAKLATDKSSKIPAIQHALIKAEEYYKQKFDTIVDLDVTSPLRNVSDIKKALLQFKKKKSTKLISGCPSRRNPYFNMVEIKNKKLLRVKKLNKKIFRRQDAPQTFDCNASIYIYKRQALKNFTTFYDGKTILFKMPEERSWDIDNKFDFKIVEFLLKKK